MSRNFPTVRKTPVTSAEAKRAIYIDFEGVKDAPPVLLGAHWADDTGRSHMAWYVFEPALRLAALATEEHPDAMCRYVPALEAALEKVLSIAEQEDRLLVEFSSHEEDVVRASELRTEPRAVWDRRIRDAKVTAKRWQKACHKDFEFSRNRMGKITYNLEDFKRLAGFPTPRYLRPAASRIRYVIEELGRKGSYQALTSTTKGKWTKLLTHNRSDCEGTRKVLLTAIEELSESLAVS